MKKYMIILSAIAATAFASCSSEITPDAEELGNEIGFNAVAHKATKADGDIVTGTDFPKLNTFMVWGFQSDKGDFSELTAASTSNFMKGVKIEWTKGSDNTRAEAWRNAEHYYYWPTTGSIGFYAIAPSSVVPTTATYGNFAIADYTIANAKTTDLMYGYAEGENRSTALPLTFNHALSQIAFVIRTDSDYSADAKFEVTKLTINNIDLTGNFAFTKPATAAWTDNTTLEEDFEFYATATEATYNDAKGNDFGAPVVMIPQSTGTTAKMTIEYKLTQADGNVQTGTVTPTLPTNFWEMGRKYIYTLNFKLNEITFSPTVTNWVAVNVAEVAIP